MATIDQICAQLMKKTAGQYIILDYTMSEPKRRALKGSIHHNSGIDVDVVEVGGSKTKITVK